MPNIASVLKAEIARLAAKAVRQQVEPLRKASAKQRRELAALKRELAQLRKTQPKSARTTSASPSLVDDGRPLRFQARGLITERSRLGLSQKDYGRLAGVSGQTILSWEQKKSTPRREQRLALQALRGIGKREAARRLESSASA